MQTSAWKVLKSVALKAATMVEQMAGFSFSIVATVVWKVV
jgi:hypothetical protein